MEKKVFPSELQDRFLVRLPAGMRDQIAESAKANNRSMNAEIVARLAKSYDEPPVEAGSAIDVLQQVTARLRALTAQLNAGDESEAAPEEAQPGKSNIVVRRRR